MSRKSAQLRRRRAAESTPSASSVSAKRNEFNAAVSFMATLGDFAMVLSFVFGGCCANVITFEKLLSRSSQVGSAMTFSQMLFITAQSLPSFLTWRHPSRLPRLKPRNVPIHQWALQVLVLTAGSLLNNWTFAYNVPLSVQIVFRSSGLAVSMLFGVAFFNRKYSTIQVMSVLLVTVGVVLATLARPASPGPKVSHDPQKYFTGVLMMTASVFLNGVLGMLQEHTYKKYGPCWKEGVFYTHCLSLPIFAFLIPDVTLGFKTLSGESGTLLGLRTSYITLAMNLVTQLICVSGVNQLTSRVTSVSTNLVLTARKATSLCLSVWLFGSGWNAGLGVGAGMVFFGSMLYPLGST